MTQEHNEDVIRVGNLEYIRDRWSGGPPTEEVWKKKCWGYLELWLRRNAEGAWRHEGPLGPLVLGNSDRWWKTPKEAVFHGLLLQLTRHQRRYQQERDLLTSLIEDLEK